MENIKGIVMRLLSITLLVLFISGCINQSAIKPNPERNASAIDTINQYRKASIAGLFDPYAFQDGITERDNYKKMEKWWCLDDSSSAGEMKRILNAQCSLSNGFERGDWCSDISTGNPIYYLKVNESSRKCAGKNTISVRVIEKPDNTPMYSWVSYATSRLKYKVQSLSEIREEENNKFAKEKSFYNEIAEKNKRRIAEQAIHNKIKSDRQFSFMQEIALGTNTHCGMVIQIRGDVVEVQTHLGTKWFRKSQLHSPGMEKCKFLNGQYVER